MNYFKMRRKSGRIRSCVAPVIITMMVLMLTVLFAGTKQVYAADAMIQFSCDSEIVKRGDSFTVLMQVSSEEAITGLDAYISYDSSRMSFVSGGKYVSGSSGLLHASVSGITDGRTSLILKLKFKAITVGNAYVGVSDSARVTDSYNGVMATTSNRFALNIKDERGQTVSDQDGNDVANVIIPTPVPSSDNTLSSLQVSAGAMDPEFNPDVLEYKLEVYNDVTTLYFNYKTSEHNATVLFIGNEELKEGDNKVKVAVTAENGDVREYVLNVKRETSEEMSARLKRENDAKNGITFEVSKDDQGYVYLQNQYRYEIVDVDESTSVPAGYKKTSVLLYGVDVTAYTVANKLDSDYLLMYCRNANGDCDFYQFDRQEKTLQRYTGAMIDKINATAGSDSVNEEVMTSKEYKSNLNQMAIIIAALVAVSVLFLIIIISLLLKTFKLKSKKTDDELDF